MSPRARTGAIVAAAALVLVSLLWSASSLSYRACVEAAEAEFPAVPVSAFVGEDPTEVGPLKVSFAEERAKAVNGCSRFL